MKAIIRPETEMKDSGIEWIGNIPRNWKMRKINSLFENIGSGTTPNSNIEEYYQGMINWLQSGDINGTIVKSTKKHISNEIVSNTSALTVYKAPFIAIAMYGASIGNMSIVDIDACTNQACCVLVKPTKDIYMQFAFWGLMAAKEELVLSSRGGGQPNISQNIIKQLRIPVPNISEQENIADYLDETCSKIDEIIAEAKASIDEYKELKQSVIFEAVTKGLDKNVEMKDSGYDFIGDIPSKWEMCKVRHLGTAQNGISIGGDAFGSGYSFVSYGDVYKNYSLPKTVDKLVRSSEEDRKRYSVEKGDWFFTRTSETIEEVGFSCVCEETIPDAVFAGFLIRVRPFNNRIYTRFAKYYFRSNHLRTFFVKEMNLVTRASLAQGLLKDAPVVVPPYDEQIEIANYLENKCTIIDGVIKDKESTIKDLESYKKSLIYEVVTGKRRVV